MRRLPTFWTEPPTHIRVYSCPACQETISIDSQSCRFCHVTTDVRMAEQRWVQNQHLTTAVSRAKAFRGSTRFAMPLTGVSLWILYVSGNLLEIWVVCQLLALSYGAQWLNHNSSLVSADRDYADAVAKVKTAMVIWALWLLFTGVVYLVLKGPPDWQMILDLFVVE